MLEEPDLPIDEIHSSLHDEYGLEVTRLTFLPLGYDMNTAVYQVDTPSGNAYFLKLRKGEFNPLVVELPYYLHKQGIQMVMEPLTTKSGQRLINLLLDRTNLTMVLYPFIPGRDGYQGKLEDHHWIELGETFRQVHAAGIPAYLSNMIPCEAYDPSWRECVKEFQVLAEEGTFTDPVAERLSIFMRSKHQEISWMVRRADELADALRQNSSEFVLCHSDAHPGNFLITDKGQLYLVDWDNPILASRERDLMFFGAGMSDDQPGGREESLFYQGYGPVEVDRRALVYYRYERILQDIAEFCKQLLLRSEGGKDRELAYTYFTGSFLPGRVVEAALKTDQKFY